MALMESPPARPRLLVHAGLFVATCASTVWAGYLSTGTVAGGLGFGATLMAILVCHEMGHYVVARRRGIDVSLPYFVPLPPQISLGTLGAIIRMRQPIVDRNHLVAVGAAGPLAGLVAAVPLLILGLSLSSVGPIQSGAYLEGNSILYIGIKYAVFGSYLPAADGTDVLLHPIAFAAWVGVLITMINLIPIGQLDGGHVACGFLGHSHERSSRWLHRGLFVMAALVITGLVIEGRSAGLSLSNAWWHGVKGGLPWVTWAAILFVLRRLSGGVYHPPVAPASESPLSAGHRRLGWITLAIFVLIFTPVPLRPAL